MLRKYYFSLPVQISISAKDVRHLHGTNEEDER